MRKNVDMNLNPLNLSIELITCTVHINCFYHKFDQINNKNTR